jgi:uncharacterized protein (TIGR03085 family)
MSETLSLARRDRIGLCDLLDELGPDAPTLCAGWSTRDLAAHLVARDRRPDSVPGLVFDPLNGWSEHVRRGEAERPYADLVTRLRAGPPRWSPLALPSVERLGNTHEFFVHFEDVRRAETGWTARTLDEEAEADLWKVLGWMRRRAFKAVPIGVVLNRPDGASMRASSGEPDVTITGPPGELLLYAFGRESHALVDVDGPADAVAALEAVERSW